MRISDWSSDVCSSDLSLIPHLINGELLSDSARTADVFNPSTGQAIHKVPLADRATIQQAIDAAKAAFPAWRNTPAAKRAQVMFRFKQMLEPTESRIARLIREAPGKTPDRTPGRLQGRTEKHAKT